MTILWPGSKIFVVQAYGGVFPGSPLLDAGKYSKCYGMQLEGYVQVAATAGITSSSAGLDTSAYANRFRYHWHSTPR